jgi:calcium-dependent protein kinase
MQNILQGLSHLSERRIIHRDLKPENIMFRQNNSQDLAICDFGLATYADEEKYLFVRCGTPGFVAPEIINIKDMTTKSDPISDIFSAGVIFHYLLFGNSIFEGKKYNEILGQNRSCEFDFNKEIYSQL